MSRTDEIAHIVDKSIPYLLVILSIIIITDIFFHDIAVAYHSIIIYIDGFIIAIVALDLWFKYQKMHQFKPFLKKYWLEIIAIIPFFLVFRVLEEIVFLQRALSESTQSVQSVLHVTTGIEKEAVALSRTQKLERFLYPLLKSNRFFKAIPFFDHPKHSNDKK